MVRRQYSCWSDQAFNWDIFWAKNVYNTRLDNTRKSLLPGLKSLVLPTSGFRLSSLLSMISCLAFKMSLEARRAGDRRKLLSQDLNPGHGVSQCRQHWHFQ